MQYFEKVLWSIDMPYVNGVSWKVAFLHVVIDDHIGVIDYHHPTYKQFQIFKMVIDYHGGVFDYHCYSFEKPYLL